MKRSRKHRLLNGPAFLDRLSILLHEGYTFHDGLLLLLPHHYKEYQDVEEELTADLMQGFGATYILANLGFTASSLLPIAIAEVDGRLAPALQGMAKRLRNRAEKQQKLKNILIYPVVLLLFITTLLLAFRRFFLPNMESLALTRQTNSTGVVSLLPTLVTKIPDLLFFTIGFALLVIGISMFLYRKATPQNKIKIGIKIPIFKQFFMMIKTRDFSSELGSLLHSGLSMQDALNVLGNQQQNAVIGEIAKQIRERVVFGDDFHIAVQMTEGLTKHFAGYAKHGEDSGYLPKELMIYSEQLSEVIDEQLTKGLGLLQPALFTLIAICILGAYLALLLPVYGMIDKI
jgi:competence protein ComGB